MSTATIILSDDNGAVACKAVFEDGWNAESHAHQHANLLLKHMDELCTRVSTPEVEVVPGEDRPLIQLIGADWP